MKEKDDLINASAVLNLAMNANPEVFKKVEEEDPMFEELQKLMKPHTDKIVEEAVYEVKATNIDALMKKFHITLEEACETIGMSVEDYKKVKSNHEEMVSENPPEA